MSTALDQELVNDFVEIFQDGLRLGRDIDDVKARLLRFSSKARPEVEAAYERILDENSLDNVNVIGAYERTGRRIGWYQPHPNDYHWPDLKKRIVADLGAEAAESIDKSSTAVVNGLLPRDVPQNSRGLVLGYVQSGKTTNFMSVIAKAADAGFRLIIVLTGITDNLREQTQERLDEQLIDPQAAKWHKLTSIESDFSGDLNAAKLSKQSERFIAVVKKNSHRLRRLNEWILSAGDAGNSAPILVIDDEADQASINVAKRPDAVRDKATRDAELERSAINAQIAQLLDHKITGYIAYTATPFANILIDPNDDSDLFPRDFLVTLPEPTGYFGSRRLFGRAPLNSEELESSEGELEGYDMIRVIPEDEVESIRPNRRKSKANDGEPQQIQGGDELSNAIRWFIMAAAARRVRGQGEDPCSMLVHTSMLTLDHEELETVVKHELASLTAEYRKGKNLDAWEQQWSQEAKRVPSSLFDLAPIGFEELDADIRYVIDNMRIAVDNGTSKNRLDYASSKAPVIAIGGNTLSRGLTLEGLVSSYFVRRATAYDTLLQMGRWFGFRPGYQDLPRIWMPQELKTWFFDLATIEAEIREELRIYMEEGFRPVEVQAKIRLHPDLQVTSKAKMQDAMPAVMSFSGKKEQTIKFRSNDSRWLEKNLEAGRKLVMAIRDSGIPERTGLYESPTFNKVPNSLILDFLDEYSFHPDTRLGTENAKLLKEYVAKEAAAGRLMYWSVSVMTQRTTRVGTTDLGLGRPLNNVSRAKLANQPTDDANIKALVTTFDRLNDIVRDSEEKRIEVRRSIEDSVGDRSREKTARKLHAKHVGPGIGHLALYPIDKDSHPRSWNNLSEEERKRHLRQPLGAAETILGVGIFFPDSDSPASTVDYVTSAESTDELIDYYRQLDEQINFINEEDEAVLEGSQSDA